VFLIPAVALLAGLIRGFTGFGGPAFMLAILSLFYNPAFVIGKILLVELFASSYMTFQVRRSIAWRTTLAIAIPTLLTMPLGHWILLHAEPTLVRKFIAGVTLFSCLLMMLGLRYPNRLGMISSIAVGLIGGLVFGASYIALLVVAVVLMGPYDKTDTRALITSWGFIIGVWFVVISVARDQTHWIDVLHTAPAIATYFIGSWIGARFFSRSSETVYRKVAIVLLMGLSIGTLLVK
jgi:uncharacterized membrane protein YfcA